jgi:hypothetical protein
MTIKRIRKRVYRDPIKASEIGDLARDADDAVVDVGQRVEALESAPIHLVMGRIDLDASTAINLWLPAPKSGRLSKVKAVLTDDLNGTFTITFRVGGRTVANGALAFGEADTTATVRSLKPGAALAEDDVITAEVSGTHSGAGDATVFVSISS